MRRSRAGWWDLLAVVAITGVGLALRMAALRGLWLDEATEVAEAKLPLGEMFGYLRGTDVHPPLNHLLMWVVVRTLGDGELAVRMPSLVLGTALIPFLYGTARELFRDRRTGLAAAALGAVAPAGIWYAQEARMYPQFMVLATGATWAVVRAVRHGGWRPWAAFSVCCGLLLWSQYFSALHIVVLLAYVGVVAWRAPERRRIVVPFLRSVIGMVVIAAPIAVLPVSQLAAYGTRATSAVPTSTSGITGGQPFYAAGANLASLLIGYHSTGVMTAVVALWPLAILGALLLLGRHASGVSWLLAVQVVVPFTLLFLVGLTRPDVFEPRYAAAAIPAALLLLARVVSLATLPNRKVLLATGVAVVVLLLAAADQQLGAGNSRSYDFRGALRPIERAAEPGAAILYEPYYLRPTVQYYAPSVASLPLSEGVPDLDGPDEIDVVASFAFQDATSSRARVAELNARLATTRVLVRHQVLHQVEVWTWR